MTRFRTPSLPRALVGLLAAAALTNCQCADDLGVVPGGIDGRACDPISGLGLPGARVVLSGDRETATDAEGRFTFARVAPGDADITVTLDGLTRALHARVDSQKNTIVTDTACRDTPTVPPGGGLEGTVCNRHTGAMITDGEVLLPLPDGALMMTNTDDEGRFALVGIPAGTHVVTIRGAGFQRSESVLIFEGSTTLLDIDGATCERNIPEDPGTPDEPTDPNDPNGGEDPGEPAPVCSTITHTAAESTDGRIFFVVDRSGSMDEDADGFNGSKWNALDNALGTVAQNLNDTVELGLMLYPTPGAGDSCTAGDVEVDLGPGRGAAVANALEDSGPGGMTPTAEALDEARQMLAPLVGDGRPLAVLLATDGGPNCNNSLNDNTCECTDGSNSCSNEGCLDDVRSVQRVEALAALGIRTYVLGLPGVESFTSVLNAMADAGGTALPGVTRFYQPTNPAALEADIDAIAQRELACRIDVDLTGAETVSVSIGAAVIAFDPAHTSGWDIIDGTTLELFGAACDLASAPAAIVSVESCL